MQSTLASVPGDKAAYEARVFSFEGESLKSPRGARTDSRLWGQKALWIGLAEDGEQSREDLLTTDRSIYYLETIANMP